MADLSDQLRAYGRQLEADPELWRAATSLPAPPAPRSRRGSGRFGWVLATAVTAAVVLVTSSIFQVARPNGGAVDQQKTSGLVFALCIFATGCTADANPASTSVAGQPTIASPAAPAATTSTATGPPNLFNSGPDVAPGTYSVNSFDVPIEITVPAGWTTWEDMGLDGPDRSYLTFFTVNDVYLDACNWPAGKAGIGPTVDDLVAGLVAQKSLQTTTPQPLDIDGFTGVELVVTSAADIDFASCYTGEFALWTVAGGYQIPLDTPGEQRTVRILDLNGDRAVIVSGSSGTLTPGTDAQIKQMVDSLEIG